MKPISIFIKKDKIDMLLSSLIKKKRFDWNKIRNEKEEIIITQRYKNHKQILGTGIWK